jgi:hypothetical protein
MTHAERVVHLLEEVLEYFEERADINYHGTGPNVEGALAVEISEMLRKVDRKEDPSKGFADLGQANAWIRDADALRAKEREQLHSAMRERDEALAQVAELKRWKKAHAFNADLTSADETILGWAEEAADGHADKIKITPALLADVCQIARAAFHELNALKAEVEGTDPLAGDPSKWGLRALFSGVCGQRDAQEARADAAEAERAALEAENTRLHNEAARLRYEADWADGVALDRLYRAEDAERKLAQAREAVTFAREAIRKNLVMYAVKDERILLAAFERLAPFATTEWITTATKLSPTDLIMEQEHAAVRDAALDEASTRLREVAISTGNGELIAASDLVRGLKNHPQESES